MDCQHYQICTDLKRLQPTPWCLPITMIGLVWMPLGNRLLGRVGAHGEVTLSRF